MDTDKELQEYVRIGRMLVANEPGEEIVITGLSARLPDSDNIREFEKNLDELVYLVSNDDRRWKRSYEDTPYSSGKVNHNEKLDAGFFDISYQQADFMDPQCRQILERSVEAIMDAGYSLSEVQQTRTGVFVGHTLSDSEKILLYDRLESPHFGFDGTSHSMLAQQISYHLKLNGPSGNVDTACSSSLYSFEHAYRAIKMGEYDNAIIAGTHIVLNPILNQFFYKLGIVSLDGDTLVFDGNGYIRSEAIAVVFIQRAKDARRIYAEVKHVKTNVDGFKEEGVTFPSQQMISQLMFDTFAELDMDPQCLDVIEAHATGTKIGDPQELNAVYQTLSCTRTHPLLIGSVKSSIGHTEPVSGLCSIIKLALGMNSDHVYPNCNFYGHDLETAMMKKNLKIVTKTLDWPKNGTNMACVNSYGFGGANSFLVLKRWMKEKKNSGVPTDDLPRLVCFSGRSEKCLQPILNDLSSHQFDEEYIGLWHAIYRNEMPNHPARGFIILSKNEEIQKSTGTFPKTPLCLAYDKLNNLWLNVLQQLSKITLFKRHIERVHKILGVTSVVNDVRSEMIGNVIVHAVTTSGLQEIGIEYQYVTGNSYGVLSAAFADSTLSLEQLISCAQSIDQYVDFANGPKNKGSDNLETTKQKLLASLQKIIPKPKPLSNKWILGNNSEDRMSAEYIVDQLYANQTHCKTDAALVVFGSSSFGAKDETTINILTPLNGHNIIESFLSGLGSIYQLGQNLKLNLLYPQVEFPVSRKTPLISPSIEWNHEDNWFVYRYTNTPPDSVQTFDFSLKMNDPDWMYLSNHVIDDQCITPMSSYLYMVWDTFSRMTGIMKVKMQVTFENIEMHRTLDILDRQHKKFVVRILKHSNFFEVEEMGEIILTGKVSLGVDEMTQFPLFVSEDTVLQKDDIYKKLRLRGYHYHDIFCGIKQFDVSNQKAIVEWNNNWAVFIDNLMQLTLVSRDDTSLELPVGIKKLSIDPMAFLSDGADSKEVFLYDDVTRTVGIELIRVGTKTLKRQKTSPNSVLEMSKFVPYNAPLSLYEAVQVQVQIVLENTSSTKLKIAEIVDEPTTSRPCLMPITDQVFQNTIGVQSQACVYSKIPLQLQSVTVSSRDPPKDCSHDLVITSSVLRNKLIGETLKTIANNGFILSREDASFDLNQVDQVTLGKITILSHFCCEQEQLVLMRQRKEYTTPTVVKINCDNQNFEWIQQLQNSLKTDDKVLLFVDNDPFNGVLGLIQTLKLEHGKSDRIKCVFIPENSDQLKLTDNMITEQLKKDLCVNILKDGVWGSQRSLLLKPPTLGKAKSVTLGNGFEWFPCLNSAETNCEKSNIAVHYASVVTKTDSTAAKDDYIVPMVEFSGVEESTGKRVMGYLHGEQLATAVQADQYLTWDVPKDWALEDAATVPNAYISAIYMLLMKANLKKGSNVMLHCLPSSITEAMVNIAKYHGCQVFITVRNREKLSVLINQYKNMPNVYVGTLDSIFFRKEILKRGGAQVIICASSTKNLNTISSYLVPNGTFLHVNSHTSKLYLDTFGTAKYMTVDVVPALKELSIKNQLRAIFQKGLNTKMIRPLSANWIDRKEIAEISQCPHEKVIVKMRNDQEEAFPCISRFFCDPEQVYALVGGLGGFGLEFIDWLIERGGRRFAVATRSSNFSGYQNLKIKSWKMRDVQVGISNCDVTTEKGCEEFLNFANKMGNVGGIFNLSAATRDELFENHTISTFITPFPSKAFATQHLDKLSRKMCPRLKYFVVFSSFVSSKGNIGQSNYTMANSSMERICEKRRVDGYPGMAIQLGAIADVGLVTKMTNYNINKVIGGALQQSLQSCFDNIDRFLMQNETIVLFMNLSKSGQTKSLNYEQDIQKIIGIINLNTVSHHVSLPELGMDSVTGIEVQAFLENNLGLVMSITEVRNLTWAKLQVLVNPNVTV